MKPVLERFLSKINVVDSGCWEWTASINEDGYGYFSYDGKMIKSHRFIYESFDGKIPQGLVIDHLCRNRKCVNPDHLECVTQTKNVKRGLTGKLNNWQVKKTHCPHGHEYSEENTIIYGTNRHCRICQFIRNNR